jgi:hypothetical protein
MIEKKDKWVEDVFNSMKGSNQVEVPDYLLKKIEEEIAQSEPKIIPLFKWKYAAAAAIIIAINLLSSFIYIEKFEKSYSESNNSEIYDQSLISTYQIY